MAKQDLVVEEETKIKSLISRREKNWKKGT